MATNLSEKNQKTLDRQSLFSGLTLLLFIQAPFIILTCIGILSSVDRVGWMNQSVLFILVVAFMLITAIAPIASYIWLKQKNLQEVFIRTRKVLLILSTGPLIALIATQIVGMFFSSSADGMDDSLAYMRIISGIVSSIVAYGFIAYAVGAVGFVGLALYTYRQKTYTSK